MSDSISDDFFEELKHVQYDLCKVSVFELTSLMWPPLDITLIELLRNGAQ